MEVVLAKSAGFCFGVKKAVDTVFALVDNNPCKKNIYTYGNIIHNDFVVEELRQKGVTVIENPEDIKLAEGGILVIRAHGVPEAVYKTAEKYNIELVDATCPFVEKIHKIVREKGEAGEKVIIAGDKTHPEVIGIMGWASGDIYAVNCEEEAEALTLPPESRVCVTAQTTFNVNKFNNIVEIIAKKGYYMNVVNTICKATETRQKEAADISQLVDVMFVIGDNKSSNTKKLFDICKSNCNKTYCLQSNNDLKDEYLQSGSYVGITAGASTPNKIIQEVFLTCQKKKISTK